MYVLYTYNPYIYIYIYTLYVDKARVLGLEKRARVGQHRRGAAQPGVQPGRHRGAIGR